MAGIKFLASLITFCFISASQAAIKPDLDWTLDAFLEGGFHIRWIKGDPEWLTMEMHAPTAGYVAVGFSPNGGMKGADIVMGWVDDRGTPHLKDLHAVGNSVPIEDSQSDYELLGAEEVGKSTIIRFRRKWNTCDNQDMAITEDTLKLIWAYGPDDPEENNFNPAYHGPTLRGIKNVLLKAEMTEVVYPDDKGSTNGPKFKTWDAVMEKHTIPGSFPTAYFCKMMKFPEIKTKHQIIGYRPLIQKENFAKVHHILFYECNVPNGESSAALFEESVGKVVPCYSENMPPAWSYCWTVPIAWTLGQEGEMYPDNVGLPIGEAHGGANYFMLEFHYDNPDGQDWVDSSGIRTYYTDEVREFDMGTIWIGNRFSHFQFIPPGQTDFPTLGGCTSECTAKAFPPGGITATHVVLHGHAAARKFTVKHIRNGQELAPLGQDLNYDNNYQQARLFNPAVQILPGDEVIAYCEYDTEGLDKPLYGGITTKGSEMCVAFLFYYPRIPLTSCTWQSEFYTTLNALGVKRVEGKSLPLLQLPYKPTKNQQLDPPDEVMTLVKHGLSLNPFDLMTVKDWNKNRGKTVAQVIDAIPWKKNNGKIANDMRTTFPQGKHYAFCTAAGRGRIPLKKYITTMPKYTPYVPPRDTTCSA